MDKKKYLLRMRPKSLVNINNFNICTLRANFLSYPLIIYVSFTNKSKFAIYGFRKLSLVYNYKVYSVNGIESKLLLKDSYFFNFLKSGVTVLLLFKNWDDFFSLLKVDDFLGLFNSVKIKTISWNGSFINTFRLGKTAEFSNYIVKNYNQNFNVDLLAFLSSFPFAMNNMFFNYINHFIVLLERLKSDKVPLT